MMFIRTKLVALLLGLSVVPAFAASPAAAPVVDLRISNSDARIFKFEPASEIDWNCSIFSSFVTAIPPRSMSRLLKRGGVNDDDTSARSLTDIRRDLKATCEHMGFAQKRRRQPKVSRSSEHPEDLLDRCDILIGETIAVIGPHVLEGALGIGKGPSSEEVARLLSLSTFVKDSVDLRIHVRYQFALLYSALYYDALSDNRSKPILRELISALQFYPTDVISCAGFQFQAVLQCQGIDPEHPTNFVNIPNTFLLSSTVLLSRKYNLDYGGYVAKRLQMAILYNDLNSTLYKASPCAFSKHALEANLEKL
ncbi:hypothetical protein [Asticcacaulis sp. W401b]|uniref:hypothetical protein n=1 Tax=Asticcacaulis sp. W401b TaxID=3388666 RepID=UPI0039705310